MEPNETRKLTEATTMLEPEEVVEYLRILRQRMPPIEPLTKRQRKTFRAHARMPYAALHASISALGASDKISHALEMPAGDVHQQMDTANRWVAVEDELRAMFLGVADANIVRRSQTAVLAGQAYNIGRQLVRDPKNADLRPHVDEIARLRKLGHPKRTAKTETE